MPNCICASRVPLWPFRYHRSRPRNLPCADRSTGSRHMAPVLRRLTLLCSRWHFSSPAGRFSYSLSMAEGMYAQTDAEQIKHLSPYLSAGQVSETVSRLIRWRYNNVNISDAVYRHVIFASVHLDRSTMQALCSFIANRDREANALLQLVIAPRIEADMLSSASQWSSSLLCKAIEIVAEKRDLNAMGILQSALLCRSDFEAIERAVPHILHTRLSTKTSSHIVPVMEVIRAYAIELKTPAFAGVFDIDRSGSCLSDIFRVFEESVSASLCPDTRIFEDLLHSVNRSSEPPCAVRRVAVRLLKIILQSEATVDIALMLKACARGAMPAKGLRLICDLGVPFQPQYAISLIKACANIPDRKKSLFHLRAVEAALMHFKVGFEPDDYRALLHVYADFGRDRIETTMALSQQLSSLNAKDITAKLRVSACQNNVEEALMLLPRNTEFGELRPLTDHFRFALLTMARTRSYHLSIRLLDLFNDMRHRGQFLQPPDSPTMTAIYNLVLRSADGRDFEEFLQRFLQKDKITADSVTLIAVYEYCAGKDLMHWHRTKRIKEELTRRVRIDAAVCSFAVRLLLRLGLLQEAVQLISESKRHRHGRNRVHPATYRTLLKALIQAKDRIRAEQVLEMQRVDGLKIRRSHLELLHSLTTPD